MDKEFHHFDGERYWYRIGPRYGAREAYKLLEKAYMVPLPKKPAMWLIADYVRGVRRNAKSKTARARHRLRRIAGLP